MKFNIRLQLKALDDRTHLIEVNQEVTVVKAKNPSGKDARKKTFVEKLSFSGVTFYTLGGNHRNDVSVHFYFQDKEGVIYTEFRTIDVPPNRYVYTAEVIVVR